MIIGNALIVHFGQDRVATADREQRERTKQQQDLQQCRRVHCFFVFGHPQTRLSGASSARHGRRCQRSRPFIAKIAAKRSNGTMPLQTFPASLDGHSKRQGHRGGSRAVQHALEGGNLVKLKISITEPKNDEHRNERQTDDAAIAPGTPRNFAPTKTARFT